MPCMLCNQPIGDANDIYIPEVPGPSAMLEMVHAACVDALIRRELAHQHAVQPIGAEQEVR